MTSSAPSSTRPPFAAPPAPASGLSALRARIDNMQRLAQAPRVPKRDLDALRAALHDAWHVQGVVVVGRGPASAPSSSSSDDLRTDALLALVDTVCGRELTSTKDGATSQTRIRELADFVKEARAALKDVTKRLGGLSATAKMVGPSAGGGVASRSASALPGPFESVLRISSSRRCAD